MNKCKIKRGLLFSLLFLLILPLALFAGGKKEESKEPVKEPVNTSVSSEREPISDVASEAAAMVNGVSIPLKTYNGQVQAIIQQYEGQGVNFQDTQLADLKIKVMENLIDQELLYQDAKSKGLTVADSAIDTQVDTVKGQFPDEATYKKELAAQGMTEEEIRMDIGKTLLVEDYITSKYGPSIKIEDSEVLTFYQGNSQYFSKPEQVRASHILIKVEPEAAESVKEDALKRINAIKDRVNNGDEFSDLARELSEGPSNTNGGDLGSFGRGKMVKSFEDAVFALDVGSVSDVVETQFGYHIIKLTAKEAASSVPLDDVRVQIVDHLTQVKMAELITSYIGTIKPGASIERYAN
ncbi:MAG: peptidylprolyl isomerase [Spirochaetia bacterium]|jgi:peptidyl-prolyl cis-trans isomerase C|nr:peptidylprolyl isomerase [Spirochaetia bacterium]